MSENENIDYQRVARAIEFLDTHFQQQPELDEVARQVHLSPHHFQRIFTEWAGVSPKKFMQYLSIDHLRSRIFDLNNLNEAAEAVGYSTQSRVYDLFVSIEAVTPREFKTGGQGLDIRYGFHPTPFGECLIGLTARGICALSFVDETNKQAEFDDFLDRWQAARLWSDPAGTAPTVEQIFGQKATQKVHLLVQGTNFQLKVWEALLKIPAGAVSTYQHIAQNIGQPAAARAVGAAIGRNPVAYLIPCHRVIRKEGLVGQYHWGSTRKKALLGCEMATSAID
ncbi:MAG TPA: methylated-DNA--[protein]-cysteine S-methyltransferase [Saprospiraceae bacterium]|nr:methylated-DNA--[protein]-cysteine S-methyltransferase [Saprospiraceae bacterium]HNM27352.1 methylated-DNA--[protein]-cysteine S-methyltransferase [Saprospiraceae bacterium]